MCVLYALAFALNKKTQIRGENGSSFGNTRHKLNENE